MQSSIPPLFVLPAAALMLPGLLGVALPETPAVPPPIDEVFPDVVDSADMTA
ncbi:hypothetical protein [Leucobacter sp.]